MTSRTRKYVASKKSQRLTWTLYDCKKWTRTADNKYEIAVTGPRIPNLWKEDDPVNKERTIWIRRKSDPVLGL